MKIARNNLMTLENGSAVVSFDANANYDVNDLLNPSFATVYNSLGSVVSFRIVYTFDEPTLISYAGLAGHNAGLNGARLRIFIDDVDVFDRSFNPNDFSTVAMATFPEQLVTDVAFQFNKTGLSTDRIVVANIQAGQTFVFSDPINNSEESGYKRPWIATGVKIKATTNRQAEPTVSLVRQMTERLTLTIKNVQGIETSPDFTQLTDFLALMASNTTWFMQENDGTVLPQDTLSNYLGFNGDVKVSAGKNRLLNDIKITFNAYIGARV